MTPAGAQPWQSGPDGIRLLVRATPRSKREGIDGVTQTQHGAALAVRVRAVAEEGKANRAVETVIAEWLGVGKTSVAVAAGGKSRLKTVEIAGEPARLAALIAARIAALR